MKKNTNKKLAKKDLKFLGSYQNLLGKIKNDQISTNQMVSPLDKLSLSIESEIYSLTKSNHFFTS